MQKVIVCDVDGILASFESAWEPLLARIAGESRLPTGWQNDPGFPPEWDWDIRAYGKEIVDKAWMEVKQSPKFWLGLKPMPETVECCKMLETLQRKGHQLYFLTSRVGLAVQRQTQEWLYQQGINYPNVITVNRWEEKEGFLRALKPDFYIDDKLETMNGLLTTAWKERWYLGIGSDGLESKVYRLKDAPYNRDGRIKGLRVTNTLKTGLKEAGLWI